jgi:hypothetical protein
LVVVKGQDGPRIVDVGNGKIVGTALADDDVWLAGDRLLHRDRSTNEMVLVDVEGQELARKPLPPALDNLSLTVGPA